MSNEKDHIQQAFATFQIPGMVNHHRSDYMADEDTALLPKRAYRYPDHHSGNHRNRTWCDHRLPYIRFQTAYQVLRKGGIPCNT